MTEQQIQDMSVRARSFVRANADSPVVYGSVIGGDKGPGFVTGCYYRLENGKTFTLTTADCRRVKPRWLHEIAA